MGTEAPTPIVIPVHCAPRKAPCPKCGKRGRRKRTITRKVRTVAYKAVASLEITYGEYAARCECSTTFRNTPDDVLSKAKYDNKVRDLVRERILDDGMSIERVLRSLKREFLLDLSTGFVYDVLHDFAAELDMAAHRRKVLEHFSGTLGVDELHLGRFTLLLATDPLSDLPVAFALVAANDQGHMLRFLKHLKTWGLQPEVVVTDGSNLYPAVLGELWPDADHQLCVFHVIKDINKLILDAVRRMRTAMGRRGKAGRKKKRGRKGAKSKATAARRGMTLKEKASFVFTHRHLIVKRRENLTESEGKDLQRTLEYLPELATLRRFADRIYWLFDTPKDLHQASCRRAAIVRDKAFSSVPELVNIVDPGFWTTRQVILDEVQTEGNAWLESARSTHQPSRPRSPWRRPNRPRPSPSWPSNFRSTRSRSASGRSNSSTAWRPSFRTARRLDNPILRKSRPNFTSNSGGSRWSWPG
jgi:transposase-like protein